MAAPRAWYHLMLALVLALLLDPVATRAADSNHQLIVRLRPSTATPFGVLSSSASAALAAVGGIETAAFPSVGAGHGAQRSTSASLASWRVLSFPDRAMRDAAARTLESDPHVDRVEAVVPIRIEPIESTEPLGAFRSRLEPGDELYPQQWSMATIGMPEVWDGGTGTPGVRVGVVDTGIAIDNPDMQPNILVNTVERDGQPEVDDDGNGFVNDVFGWDFTGDIPDPDDGFGHGTHVAGIIGAASDDAFGVVGVTWDVDLIAVKMFDDRGVGTNLSGAQGIVYAVERGAHIINMSWTTPTYSSVIADAIQFAAERNVVLVAAAGNASDSVLEFYPSALDPVITVSATNASDRIATFSNRGNRIDLAAPGVDIVNAWRDRHLQLSGTSQAAPHVAGVAAHLLHRRPGITPEQVRGVLTQSAVDLLAPGWDPRLGAGRLDAAAALAIDVPMVATIRSPSTLDSFGTQRVPVIVDVEGTFVTATLFLGAGEAPTEWEMLWTGGAGAFQSVADLEVGEFDEQAYTLRLVVESGDAVVEDRVQLAVDRTAPTLLRWEAIDQLAGGRMRQLVRIEADERVSLQASLREVGGDAFERIRNDDAQSSHALDLTARLPGTFEFQLELVDRAGEITRAPAEGALFEREVLPLIDVPTDLLVESRRLENFEVGAVIDLNGDGWPEVLGESRAPGDAVGRLHVFGFGGTSLSPERFATGLQGLPLSAADMNADGLIEVALADSIGSGPDGATLLAIYTNVMSDEPNLLATIDDGNRLFRARLEDVNRDGRADLIYASYTDGRLRVSELRGDALVPIEIEYSEAAPRVVGVAVDDFDGDGLTDLAMGTVSGDVLVLEANGNRLVEVSRQPLRERLSNALVAAAIGDTDGDGKPEFAINTVGTILSRDQRPGVSVFEATGDDTYEPTAWFEVQNKNIPFDNDLAAVDVDVDGEPEFLFAVANDVYLVDAVGDDRFVPIWHVPRSAPGRVANADLDRDGQPEVLVVELLPEGPVTTLYEIRTEERTLDLAWNVRRLPSGNQIRWTPPASEAEISDLAIYRLSGPHSQSIESDLIDRRVHAQRGTVDQVGAFLDVGAAEPDVYTVAYTVAIDGRRERVLAPVIAPVAPTSLQLVVGALTPSPFRDATGVSIDLPDRTDLRVRVYDVLGRMQRSVVDEPFQPGLHTIDWDGRDDSGQAVASGVYFMRLESAFGTATRKVVRLR